MKAFQPITSRAIVWRRANVDTDIIIPAAHLKTVSREGLGNYCFQTVRYDETGRLRNSSPFDHGAARASDILLAGENFGCGSSREHAVWALMDMGIACIIAPSFADIFFGNAMKNGLLLIRMGEEEIERLAACGNVPFHVDLESQTITPEALEPVPFEIDAYRKERLLAGRDEISQTLEEEQAISDFEEQDRVARRWLYA